MADADYWIGEAPGLTGSAHEEPPARRWRSHARWFTKMRAKEHQQDRQIGFQLPAKEKLDTATNRR